MDGVADLESEVRELFRRRAWTRSATTRGVRDPVSAVVAEYDERSLLGAVPPLTDPTAASKAVVDAVPGLVALQRQVGDENVAARAPRWSR